jgi:hypothetical protein
MEEPRAEEEQEGGAGSGSNLARIVKITLIAFALSLAALAIVALLTRDASVLPFDYEGFD